MRAAEAVLRASPSRDSFSLAVTYYDRMEFAMLDVIHPSCSKGATLAEWTARRGYSRDQVMAIGDNFNDVEMLGFAGLPVVMANSVTELKNMGYRQTLSNDHAGVAAAIETYALKNSEL
jgi:hydroxymethylpyrimidine pyrophosphatase-like HAD family hydrolase